MGNNDEAIKCAPHVAPTGAAVKGGCDVTKGFFFRILLSRNRAREHSRGLLSFCAETTLYTMYVYYVYSRLYWHAKMQYDDRGLKQVAQGAMEKKTKKQDDRSARRRRVL